MRSAVKRLWWTPLRRRTAKILFLSLLPLLDGDNAAEKLAQQADAAHSSAYRAEKSDAVDPYFSVHRPKNVRGRLLTYLSGEAARQGRYEFDIPFNRQQLADYLNLDRSALSRELSRMRDEGMLAYRRNHFILYKTEN